MRGKVLSLFIIVFNSVISDDPEAYMDAMGIIRHWGFPAEEYEVVIEDGYILSLFRIPHGRTSDRNASCDRPVILMAPGLSMDSRVFILNPPESSVAFILADAGFDVFLLNHRVSTYSRRHVSLSPDDETFWQFTIDDYARYDAIAVVDKVLEVSGHDSLHWIGHSLGTLTGFMALAGNPEYNGKVKSLLQVAPVGSVNHMRRLPGFGIHLLRALKAVFYMFRHMLGAQEIFVNQAWLYRPLAKIYLSIPFLGREIINDYVTMVFGAPSKSDNWIALRDQVEHFDYSSTENIRRYGQSFPPAYNYSAIDVPVYLYWSRNDWTTTDRDIDLFLLHSLTKISIKGGMEIPEYGHADFVVATDCAEKLWNPIAETIRSLEHGDCCRQ